MDDILSATEAQARYDDLRERERTLRRDLDSLEDDAFGLATDLADAQGADPEEQDRLDDLHAKAGDLNDRIRQAFRELET